MTERRAVRRAQLVAAATALLAEGGGPAVTVRAVCRRAELTERYFYESFPDRDTLILTVYDELAAEVTEAIVLAVAGAGRDPHAIATAAVDTAVGLILDRPETGRVLFVSLMTDPLLYAKVDEFGPVLAGLIGAQLPGGSSEEHRTLVASGLAGALGHLFHQYVAGSIDVSREAFVRHCVDLLTAMSSQPVRSR